MKAGNEMTTGTFLLLLSSFSTLSSLVTEGIKKRFGVDRKFSYNLLALLVALVIGCVGTGIYYQFHAIEFTTNNILCLALMGFASGLTSMIGYDKVSQLISQLTHNKSKEYTIRKRR